jgi:hypothetical protein
VQTRDPVISGDHRHRVLERWSAVCRLRKRSQKIAKSKSALDFNRQWKHLNAAMPDLDPDRLAILFVQNAYQYYAVARFAMHAQCMPVCGILFHHTVEMFLKGGLVLKRPISELEAMRHRLKVIWRAFKADFPEPSLERHNTAISRLDKFDVIRYPDAILEHGMGTTAQWRCPAAEVIAYGGIKTPKQYVVVVSDIDDLVADVLKVSSWNPGRFAGTNPVALEAITRYNDHSEFLTTVRPAES